MSVTSVFLKSISASLHGERLKGEVSLSAEEWEAFFALAGAQKVLPLVFDAVLEVPGIPGEFYNFQKRFTISQVMTQTRKTAEFLDMYDFLTGKGLHPLVVKGIICREMYPAPDSRISADEDLLVPADEFERTCAALKEYGMICKDANGPKNAGRKRKADDPAENAGETGEEQAASAEGDISFVLPGSPLYIEVHRTLFSESSEAYGNLNHYFTDVHKNAVMQEVQGHEVLTASPPEHMLYLILHAFKHFLHSGFGIRQVCDIVMFAEHYKETIDWPEVRRVLEETRTYYFAAAIFKIGKKHLKLDVPEELFGTRPAAGGEDVPKADTARSLPDAVDERPLLTDIIGGGIYGGGKDRQHSSTMTLNAASKGRTADKSAGKPGILRAVFPKAKSLEGKYPYLKKTKALLPVAWGTRLVRYIKENTGSPAKAAAGTMRIGAERVELLKKYKIID